MPPAVSRRKKSGKVYDEIRAMALRLGPDARLPTMTQLRDTLGASIATLDSVLGDLEARNIIRRKQGSGIYVSSHVKKPIALLINLSEFSHSNASPFWSLLLEQARKRAAQWSDMVHFYATFDEQESKAPLSGSLLENIERGRIQGILGVGIPEGVSNQLIALDLPHVVYAAYGGLMVAQDHNSLIESGVAALAAQNCKNIQMWRQMPAAHEIAAIQEENSRISAIYRRALNQNGLQGVSDALRQDGEQFARIEAGLPLESRQEQGFHLAQAAFSGAEIPPDGILLLDDMMTFGALAALRKMRIEPGQDVKIATHANAGSSILMGYEDSITRLEFDSAELIETMFALLETWMGGEKPAENIHYLHPKLRLPE